MPEREPGCVEKETGELGVRDKDLDSTIDRLGDVLFGHIPSTPTLPALTGNVCRGIGSVNQLNMLAHSMRFGALIRQNPWSHGADV